MSDTRALAVQLVALATLSERVAAHTRQVRAELQAALAEGDRVAARLDDDDRTDVGAVTYVKGSTSVQITDEQEFTEFVSENYPSEMQLVVRPAFRAAVLEASAKAGTGMCPDGAVCPGVSTGKGAGHLMVRKEASGRAALLEAVRANRLLALDGPEVES